MLSIRKLRESLNGERTKGTQGTANEDAAFRCFLTRAAEGTEGTKPAHMPQCVPFVPSGKQGREQETANVHATVPCVPSVPSQNTDPGAPKSSPVQNPSYWEEDFFRWALAHCLFKDGCLWRVEALHDHFCGWCLTEQTVGCMLPTFAALLASEGFPVTAGMVQELVLREEYLSLTAPERKAKAAPMWNRGEQQ